MTWVMTGIAAVTAIAGFMGQSSAAKAQSIIAKAQADAENTIRKANNMTAAANSAMINTARAEDTKQKFKAAGAEWNAMNKNIVRLQDQAAGGKVNERIMAAEELGSLYANAAFAGVGGSTIDSLEAQADTAIKTASQGTQDTVDQQVGDLVNARDALFMNAAMAVDNSTTFASIDRGVSIPGYVAKPSAFTAAASFFNQAAPYIKNQLGEYQMRNAQAQSNSFQQGIKNNYGANTKI